MNKRKQKLEIKAEDLLSADKDLLMDCDVTSDWFSSSANSDLDIPTNVMYDDILDLFNLPFNFEDEEPLSQGNKEIFQDLCCTSTPKSSRPSVSKIFNDSGIEGSILKKSRKENDNSYRVLEDITEKIDSFSNRNFINISQLPDSTDSSLKKRVSILRKDLILQSKNKSGNDGSSSITKEQMVYYSGIKNYATAIAVLKHIKMPKSDVSSFKMELMALMKLRLDLPWLDMSFRFSVSENTLKDIVKKAFDIMSHSLEDLMPWHAQKKIVRRNAVRTYYVHTLISSQSSNILVVLMDSKRPVLYVSESYSSDISPVWLILNNCSSHLIPGDVLCIVDATGGNTFYTIHNSSLAGLLSDPTFNHYSLVEKCNQIMTEMLSEFTFLTKHSEDLAISKVAKVAGAITNINYVSDVTPYQLQKIYEKSSSCITEL